MQDGALDRKFRCNMYIFMSKRELLTRSFTVLLVMITLSLGVYLFNKNERLAGIFDSAYRPTTDVITTKTDIWQDRKESVKLALRNKEGQVVLGVTNQEAKSVPVLLYHGIVENNVDGINKDVFIEHMYALKRNGWNTISIDDFYSFLKGQKLLPDKSFLLTFDDGRKDSYYYADPVLEALDFKGVMFVITDRSIGKVSSFHLNENELLEMHKTGRWDIGSHGKLDHDLYKTAQNSEQTAHFLSNLLWLEEQNRIETVDEFKKRITSDLSDSKDEIEKLTGKNVISFAYPFGDFGQDSENFPESEGITPKIVSSIYPISFFQIWIGRLTRNYPDKNQTLFKRINVEPNWDADTLLGVLEKSRDKELPYSDKFVTNLGWQQVWGETKVQNGRLTLSAKPETTGASTVLDGSFLWKNVSISAKVKSVSGSTVSIIARDNDEGESARCSFSNEYVSYRAYTDNMETRKVNTKRDTILEGKVLGMEVDGNAVRCLINNVVVIDIQHRGEIPANGRIGFGSWTSEPGMSKLILEDVEVKEL